MKFYPIFLDVRGRECLVVGGGDVGTRKALGLVKSGARVRVVSLAFSPGLEAAQREEIILACKAYERSDMDKVFLVFAATDNQALNEQIQADAKQGRILCNIADAPDFSDFILPSVVERGDLVCAVSTSGSSPALARKIRQELEQLFGPEYTLFLSLMKNIRKILLEKGHDPGAHQKIFNTLVEKNLPALIAAGDEPRIDSILLELLGRGYAYRCLVSQEP